MNNFQNRNAKLLYRDLIRLVKIVMENPKKTAVLKMVRGEFEKNKSLKDENEILKLKNNACKAIGDLYVYYVKNTIKDDPNNPNKDNLI
jgi:hypothetical protein